MPSDQASPVFEVIEGGPLTTVQDLGRMGHLHEGVPRSGAADGLSLAVANALAGNPADAAALEVTVGGLHLRALRGVTVGLGGADLGAVVAPDPGRGEPARRLAPGSSHSLHAGGEIAFEGRPTHGLGCRAYLALPGGFDVPDVLGSRSTSLVGGFGGFDGRALRAGDVLSAAGSVTGSTLERPPTRLPAGLPLPSPAQRLRIIAVTDAEPGGSVAEQLAGHAWTVAGNSDRRGLRLLPASGGGVAHARGAPRDSPGASLGGPEVAADRPSEPVIPGTIQVTPSGQPLVLMPDAGTTGGYAVAAVVIAADLPLLGQLAPWDEVRFRIVDLPAATEAARDRRRLRDAIAMAVGAAHRAN
ncbi:MAG TPA: biotin-dependent carboxyltransferase family protein [Candidatus Limnocylindrales bacterium]